MNFHKMAAKSLIGIIFIVLSSAIFAKDISNEIQMVANGNEIMLSGIWDAGVGRKYDTRVLVPGLVGDPAKITDGTVWYRRSLTLPAGPWSRATLKLNGARFAPSVYVDGKQVSKSEGGMAPTYHDLNHENVRPGRTMQIEIALKSLDDLDPLDASAIPRADRWRSNISSCLWDDVILHFSGKAQISHVIPVLDYENRQLRVRWHLDNRNDVKDALQVYAAICDLEDRELVRSKTVSVLGNKGECLIELGDVCIPWTPDTPNLYHLKVVLAGDAGIEDRSQMVWGLRDFKTHGLGFLLNGKPVSLRAGTVVWHRFLRDPEGQKLAFDVKWFEENIIKRLKKMGANTLRFHLGAPPEALLDLCDRHGLMVQYEWSFFHGIEASVESMKHQWRNWLNLAMKHPSVVIIHPWNETEGAQIKKAHEAIKAIEADYPPLVMSHRDVIHIHKYWWSLFENVGLYYDSPNEFEGPIMVDEFGGNYLDNEGNVGGYRTLEESFLRFLGRNHTAKMRLRHQAEANARIAEYWRRLGAAGFSPFCILGSPPDGNTWFLGSLRDPQPKPVWAALSAAYAPVSTSIAIWNRNFTPGQVVEVPVYLFNDSPVAQTANAAVRIVSNDGNDRIITEQALRVDIPAYGTIVELVKLAFPQNSGEWILEAELLQNFVQSGNAVKSTWHCRTLEITLPKILRDMVFGVPQGESELRALLNRHGLQVVSETDSSADVLIYGSETWGKITSQQEYRENIASRIESGKAAIFLDVGPTALDDYLLEARRNRESAPILKTKDVATQKLFDGIDITFMPTAEPESHIHAALGGECLWKNLPAEATWLWNGLRGGLIVPPYDMDVLGLGAGAFLAMWESRGADKKEIVAAKSYYAYELEGYYEFSNSSTDEAVKNKLRGKVIFLLEDAPALQGRINPDASITISNLARVYRGFKENGQSGEIVPLVNCGKNLTRVPVVMIRAKQNRGVVIMSQLLTKGRLSIYDPATELYKICHDPAAEQFVLNMISMVMKTKGKNNQ